jgi:hypothetical protein
MRILRTGAVLTVAAIVCSSPCFAQLAIPIHLFPVMAKVSGQAGTDWVSSMSVANLGDEEFLATALFFRENQNNIPLLGPRHDFLIEAGQTVTVGDVLGQWFPEQGNTKGFLVLFGEIDEEATNPFVMAASGRIFNQANPQATYGQTAPSSLLGLMVAPGAANLPGARSDDGVRSNVGVINLSIFPLSIIATTYAADGTVVASVGKTVRAFSLGQWSLEQLGVASMSPEGRVHIEVDPSSITWDPCFGEEPDLDDLQGIFLAYMSRVDEVTGDAEFILAQNDWSPFIDLCGEQPTTVPVERHFDRR